MGQHPPMDRSKRFQERDVQLVLRQHIFHVLRILRHILQP